MKNTLIIWDFDGVIADSEKLWIRNWTNTLKKMKGISLNAEQQEYYLAGKSEKTKSQFLQRDFPDLIFDDVFWKVLHKGENRLMQEEMKTIPGVEKVLADTNFMHCIATGATVQKNNAKLAILHLESFFPPQNRFSAEYVENGKPAPDLFLYAAEHMGFAKNNCVVIEDSIVGITAAKAAGLKVIAFIGATGNNTPKYAALCQKTGADFVVDNMADLHRILKTEFMGKGNSHEK